MNTREKILGEALRLFSVKGYHAVSVRDIAGAVGIKESSLYNHFKNKQDIFDKLVDAQWERARRYFESRALPFEKGDDITDFQETDFEKLAERVIAVFAYFVEDEENIRFRRLLILSQYENDKAKEIYRSLYRDYMLDFQTHLFARLIQAGILRRENPAELAIEFYGPVFLYLHTSETAQEAKVGIRRHLKQFLSAYAVK